MKTALFTGIYLEGQDHRGDLRLDRNIKYLNYYWPLRRNLGFNDIVLSDNASKKSSIDTLLNNTSDLWTPDHANQQMITVLEYEDHLAAGKSGFTDRVKQSLDYPYCWRTLWTVRHLFLEMHYEKVLLIDSDMFVLSSKLADYVKNFDDGWLAFWCARHNFPEAAFQIIAGDGIQKFLDFTAGTWGKLVGQNMEKVLPFTKVEKDFIGDRYGEIPGSKTEGKDYFGQAEVDRKFYFEGVIL